jgi:protoporphyrinogen IX oxidase
MRSLQTAAQSNLQNKDVHMDLTLAWVKGIHITTLVIWCAGLLCLPGLFATHCEPRDLRPFHRLRAMSRFSYIVIVSPAAIIAILSGSILVWLADVRGGWLPVKLSVVAMMAAYHTLCGHILSQLREPEGFRQGPLLAMVAVPVLLIPMALWLVLAKPL